MQGQQHPDLAPETDASLALITTTAHHTTAAADLNIGHILRLQDFGHTGHF